MVSARFVTAGGRGSGQSDPCANGLDLAIQYETLLLVLAWFNLDPVHVNTQVSTHICFLVLSTEGA